VIGIVLVHGLFHGAWCWDKVVPRLCADDVVIAAPDMSGAPLDPSGAQAAVDRLAEHGPVVVCGHSWAGYPVAALDPSKIARIVLLAAFITDDREWFPGLPVHRHFFDMVATDASGVMTPKPDRSAELFYGDCTDEDARRAINNLCPASVEGMRNVVDRPAWREVPTIYVQCSEDNVLTQKYERAALARVGRGLCMQTSHSPMISRPDLVADLLNSVVAELRG
jgi:pimeloyl-ACP methyl ester carboxylesterase